MAVRKTSIFGEVYLLSDTVVCASSETALERFQHQYDAPRPPQFAIYFRSGSWFEHSWAQLNMDQSDSINNRTVKFVVSYRVVFKQVEVSTILASVESTGSWLHAGICPVFMRWNSSRDIAQYRSNSPIYTAHKSTSVFHGKKHGIYYISGTTQRINTGQVPACNQEPVDSTDANIYGDFNLFEDNTVRNDKFYRPIIDRIGLVHVQLCP